MFFDRRLASFQVTSGVGAKQHQFFYHLRMAGRVLNRNWTALRNSQQGRAIKLKRVYHDLEVTDPSVESKALHIPIREAGASLVKPDDRVIGRQLLPPMTPNRAVPLEFNVR